MRGAIAKKDTLLGSKFKFCCIVGSEMRPGSTLEGLTPGIVRFCMKELLKRRGKLNDTRGKIIYKISCS
jgi:hypothetical protein